MPQRTCSTSVIMLRQNSIKAKDDKTTKWQLAVSAFKLDLHSDLKNVLLECDTDKIGEMLLLIEFSKGRERLLGKGRMKPTLRCQHVILLSLPASSLL